MSYNYTIDGENIKVSFKINPTLVKASTAFFLLFNLPTPDKVRAISTFDKTLW